MILTAAIGGFITIALLSHATLNSGMLLILGSFGASCVLVFGVPASPFSQPRNIIAGHMISSLCGLVAINLFGPTWLSVALACGFAIAIMMSTRTVHPPAGSNPVIVFLSQPGWDFLLFPTLLGALAITAIALVYNNITNKNRYPRYW